MLDSAKCFKSGNTLRISISRYLRYHLKAEPGDMLQFTSDKEGTATVVNLSHQHRTNTKGKRK